MAIVGYKYNTFNQYLMDNTIQFGTDTLKLALVTSSYTPSLSHNDWADVSANEVSAGDGYTTGGASLTGVTISAPPIVIADADDVVFTALTKTFRYGVLYASVTRNGVTNPLIGYILFNNAPADVVVSGANWTVQWGASGFLRLY